MDDSTYIGLKTRPRERVDIRIGTERRRRWGRDEKLRIVRESLAPNAVVSDVARRNESARTPRPQSKLFGTQMVPNRSTPVYMNALSY